VNCAIRAGLPKGKPEADVGAALGASGAQREEFEFGLGNRVGWSALAARRQVVTTSIVTTSHRRGITIRSIPDTLTAVPEARLPPS